MKMIALKDPFQFINYDKSLSGEFINTGHSGEWVSLCLSRSINLVQFVPNPTTDTPQIKGGMLDQTYKFIQYHYHWAQENNKGSEHALCGLRYPAELHLVRIMHGSINHVLLRFIKESTIHPSSLSSASSCI